MKERTTIQVERPLLAELRRHKYAGRTYTEVIRSALRALDREHFLNEQEQIYLDSVEGRDTLRRVR